jgi:hypothetical protein
VFSGRDSLFQTFRRARANYNSHYNIPQPPPPPDNFSVKSGGNKINLSWSSSAESWPIFNGYRIYRRSGTDTTFDLIFSCDKGNVQHAYADSTAKAGSIYFYYIVTKDNGSTNDIQAGVPLVSSKFYTMTNLGAQLYFYNVGDFESHQSGDWNDVHTWERFDGSSWVNPAPSTPTNTSGVINILNGHTINVLSADSADQLTILSGGTLTIETNATFRVKNGIGIDLTVNGTLTNFGSIEADDSVTISFGVSSKYLHERNGGSIPMAIWGNGSTCQFDSIKGTVPSNVNQNFSNVIWDCPNQNANLNLNWQNGISIGSLTVKNTNWNHTSPGNPSFRLGLFSAAGSCSIGSLSIQGSHTALVQQDGNFIDTIGIGNITLSGGGLLLLSTDNSGIITNNWGGNFTIPDSGSIGSASSQSLSTINFYYGTVYSVPLTGVNYIGHLNFFVSNGAALSLGTSALGGSGSFTLAPSATLETMAPGGLDSALLVTGAKSLSDSASYIFDGSAAQETGILIPDTIGNLTINNNLGVTLSRGVDVNGTLEMKNGMLSIGSHILSYGINSSLRYTGTGPQTTTNAEFPSSNGPKNLAISNLKGITLHETRTINGSLGLAGKLIVGTNTIMAATATSTDINFYVMTEGGGALMLSSVGSTEKLFPVGTKSAYAPVWIMNTGTVDTIRVSAVDDIDKPVGGGRVMAKWNIAEQNPGDGIYRLKLGWMKSLEDSAFSVSTLTNWKIFKLPELTEPGSGTYTRVTITGGRSIRRANVTVLGTFTVGTFTSLTDVEESQTDIPVEFSLKQNYPNPFNPTTTIIFDLPKKSQVSLKIYDLLGREIAILVNNEEMSAGSYSKGFNASRLTSGVYFYRIQAGAFTKTKKFLLLK